MKLLSMVILLGSLNPSFAREGGKMGHLAKELNLTQDQIEKLKAHRESMKDQNKGEGHKEMKALHEELKAKFLAGASAGELQAIHEKLKAKRSAGMDKRFQKMLFLSTLLTSEQKKKFIEMQDKRRDHRRGPEDED